MALVLPEEIWERIMEIGIEKKMIDYKTLCSLSISCRLFNKLSNHNSLWATLLLSDFPSSTLNPNHNNNTLYKISYEKDKDQKRLAHRRVVLRIESEIAVCSNRIRDFKLQSFAEKDKLNKAVAELMHLHKVRQASASLNVWQPEIIRGSHKQLIEQCTVPVENRIKALEMELSLCRQQIAGFDNTIRVEKRRLTEAKERLDSVKYHPLRGVSGSGIRLDESRTKSKKLKKHKSSATHSNEFSYPD